MISNKLKFGATAFLYLLGTTAIFAQQLTEQEEIKLNDLSAFISPGNNWSVVENITLSPRKENEVNFTKGSGVLVHHAGKKDKGADLFTQLQHGHLVLELDFLLSKGANSGIYLQGNYEVQLNDSWAVLSPQASDNGGIYERWDDTKPEGFKGFGGYAPRQNASKAPGLWQHLKVVFQAPQFDAAGVKRSNARILSAELNGVLVHDNLELFGPTKGGRDQEKPLGPLRLQSGDGLAAFKNIKISKVPEDQLYGKKIGSDGTDPIYIDAPVNTMIRSFVDISYNKRAVHAISVGTPQKVHYSYDLDNGLLLFGWSGEFVDATPMWDGRGNGTSKARGVITRFTDKLAPAVAKLSTPQATWPTDTIGTGFRTRGYILDNEDKPKFKYDIYGANVTDSIKVVADGKGLSRTITIDKPVPNLYVLLANGNNIQEIAKGLYRVDGESFYVELNEMADKPIIRDVEGRKEMIILLGNKLRYHLSF